MKKLMMAGLVVAAALAVVAIRVAILTGLIFFAWNWMPFNIDHQITSLDALGAAVLFIVIGSCFSGGGSD